MAYPVQSWLNNCYGAAVQNTYARSDYCANAGDQAQPWDIEGPPDLATGDGWTATNAWTPPNTGVNLPQVSTGICYLRSQIGAAHVTDGLSNTYLVGEKYLNADNYTTAWTGADNESMYAGYDNDNHRCTNTSSGVPAQDTPGYSNSCNFGSVHAGSFNMGFCDGSVQAISYNIDHGDESPAREPIGWNAHRLEQAAMSPGIKNQAQGWLSLGLIWMQALELIAWAWLNCSRSHSHNHWRNPC